MEFEIQTFIHELIGKTEGFKNKTKISLFPLVDWRGVAWAPTLLYHSCNHAWCFPNVPSPFGKSLEQKWKYCFYCHSSRWGPQSRMDPSLPKECSAGAASFQAWPALPGENQGYVSQLTQTEAGPGAKGYGAFTESHPNVWLQLYQSSRAYAGNLWSYKQRQDHRVPFYPMVPSLCISDFVVWN